LTRGDQGEKRVWGVVTKGQSETELGWTNFFPRGGESRAWGEKPRLPKKTNQNNGWGGPETILGTWGQKVKRD